MWWCLLKRKILETNWHNWWPSQILGGVWCVLKFTVMTLIANMPEGLPSLQQKFSTFSQTLFVTNKRTTSLSMQLGAIHLLKGLVWYFFYNFPHLAERNYYLKTTTTIPQNPFPQTQPPTHWCSGMERLNPWKKKYTTPKIKKGLRFPTPTNTLEKKIEKWPNTPTTTVLTHWVFCGPGNEEGTYRQVLHLQCSKPRI